MKISYAWLQEYFDKPLPQPKELADLLNIRAFEVEDVEEIGDDSIFEIKITPDRAPDCLSHDGIAREVGIHARLPLIKKEIEPIEGTFENAYAVDAHEKSCHRYMLREIRSVVVQDSPVELKKKLEAIGQRSINTIVDITNLVMFEIGQPLHAFDADKVVGKTITIGEPKDLKIITLDGKEIELTPEDLTIQDEAGNLAIAGVKGGNRAEVNSETKNIILESANFYPVKVRKTSKRTGIQNDSSKRFENGMTPERAQRGIDLASQYISKYASTDDTQFSTIVDVYPRKASPYFTGFTLEEANRKLGLHLTQKDVEELLSRLGFEFSYLNTKEFVTEEIRKHLGTPHNLLPSLTYDAPHSFDCTTLTAYVFAHGGLSIPRISIDQLFFGTPVESEELEAGDLIFSTQDNGGIHFETVDFLPGQKFQRGVDHVGMYMGDGKVIHSSRFNGAVKEELVSEADCFKNIVGYRRMVSKDEMRFAVHVPNDRLDIRTGIDLIEEIGRTYGYEQVAPACPELSAQSTTVTSYDKLSTLKSLLINLGFDEVVTYTFQKKGDISVVKPLAKDKAYLRTDLAKGISEALDLNSKNRELFAQEVIRIFEIGHTFTEAGEKTILAIGVRSATKKIKSKAVLEEALATLSQKTDIELSRTIPDNQEIVEIELDELLEKMTEATGELYVLPASSYVPFSPYPFMTRDIAVWATHPKTKEDIERVITDFGTELLLRYDLFDTYASDGKTSYAYRLVFQASDRTLTDEEVGLIMDKMYGIITNDSDFEIR